MSYVNSARAAIPYRNPANRGIGKQTFDRESIGWTLFFLVIHFPLGLLMSEYQIVATIHALCTLMVGAFFALSGKNLARVAYVGAYIVGAEVLWRMNDAQIYWEFAKYATCGIFILAIIRNNLVRFPLQALLYFSLLLPSAVLTVENANLDLAIRKLSFNLSGPLALAVCIWFFTNLEVSMSQLYRMFLAAVGPIVGVSAVVFFKTATATDISFSGASNAETSGGFGPNQVSSILGLGVLLAFFSILNPRSHWAVKVILFALMILFASQSALTFSRTGLFLAICGILAASVFLITNARARAMLVMSGLVVFVVGNFVILPWLNSFTSGAIVQRFEDTSTTGRIDLFMTDLKVWQENFFFGVGPGQGKAFRKSFDLKGAVAHTEFSRLLAEHGILGLISMILLFSMSINCMRRTTTPTTRALTAALMGWSLLFLLVLAMRLVAPSFMFAVPFLRIIPERVRVLLPGNGELKILDRRRVS